MNCISTTQDGYTPLVSAASYGKWDVVIELLDNGADVNAQTNVSFINTVTNFKLVDITSNCIPLPVTTKCPR